MPERNDLERICKNCGLYNKKNGFCQVWILHEGRKIQLPMEPTDPCFFEQPYTDPKTGETSTLAEDIQQVRMWVEDERGTPTAGNGTVKIEYPVGFFPEPRR